MTTRTTLPFVCATLLALAGCIVPPSMLERASWGPPPEYWQEQGRYRQAGDAGPAAAQREPLQPAPGATGQACADPAAEGAPASAAPLYAWDGGVVDGAPQGRVTAQEGTPRGLETPPAGRMHIIELYQQVLDERDALAEEVELLRASLEATRIALENESRESNELAARVAALEAAHADLLAENQSIAARLVQAQIRRLEAEKLLLETRIEGERAKAEEAARATAAQGRPAAKPKAPVRGSEEGHE